MYDEKMEVIIPSMLKQATPFLDAQYIWASDDGRTWINITLGNADLDDCGIDGRLDEYYHGFCSNINGFECGLIKKRIINQRPYGEIRYLSKMADYDFFNIFLLGAYQGRELIFTIQSMDIDNNKFGIHVFENVMDSLRIKSNTAPHYASDSLKAVKEVGMELVYIGNNNHFVINMDDDELAIGRGIIPHGISNAVSRKHCLITKTNNKYFVQDLKSANYTFVNGIVIPPYEIMELEHNDILTLADIEFRVRIINF
jgi:hypothetical protein